MRAISTRETLLHVIIAINLMLSVTLTRGTVQVAAQTGCPPLSGTGRSFPANTSLTVYLDSAFTDQQRTGIMAGFAGWTGASGSAGNASGIVIDHVIVGPPPNPLPVNSIQVIAGTPTGGVRGETILNPGGPTTGTTLVNAIVTIDPRVTTAMQEVADHEGGHALMGLRDTTSAVGVSESIMSPAPLCASDAALAANPGCGTANYNALRPLAAPTPCDQLAA
ncbi:MAG TPA: hypothetical protein VJQ25_02050, partial [Nitrospira sp.]|nr:hypothetical protein [Nitrospira sp.]